MLAVDGECVTETEYLGSGQLFFVRHAMLFVLSSAWIVKNIKIFSLTFAVVCVCVKNVSVISPILFSLIIIHLSLSLLKGLIYADPFSNGTTGDVISLSEACANFSEADFTVD